MNAVCQPPKLAAPSTIDGVDVAQNLGYSSPIYRLIACGSESVRAWNRAVLAGV
jgi:hypothetical protein